MKKVLPYLAIALLLVPLVVSAQNIPRGARTPGQISAFLDTVASWLYIVGIAIVIVVVVIGGILYLTAGGNEDQIGKAKKTIANGLIGGAIVLLAGIIVDTVANFISTNV